MTRIFNFALLFLVAGIYYVQNDGFSTANATNEPPHQQDATQVAASTPIETVTPMKVVAKSAKIEPTSLQLTSNILTQNELDAIEYRFIAERLVNSTVIVPVTLVKPQLIAKTEYLLVSGNMVNARAEPTTSAEILAKLRRGTQVEPTGRSDGVWAEVIVVDTGEAVWMHSDFLISDS